MIGTWLTARTLTTPRSDARIASNTHLSASAEGLSLDDWAAFETEVQDALRHMYDSRYLPPERLCACLRLEQRSNEVLCDALLAQIAALEPSQDAPGDSPDRAIYEVLALRYLHNLTQETTAERLGMTPRHLRRKQREAVGVLAHRIWERRGEDQREGSGLASDWQTQVRDELRALETTTASSESDVVQVLRSLAPIAEALSRGSGVQVTLGETEPDMVVRMPAAALRQVLIASLSRLVHCATSGAVDISARRQGPRVTVTLCARPAIPLVAEDFALARQVTEQYGGQAHVLLSDASSALSLSLEPAGTLQVLVVDDNESLVHFYRRFCAGTRYAIEHLSEGRDLIERVGQIAPDMVVLDVMMPEVDGWELLSLLHANESTLDIPVLVCSVVKEPGLALSLGASHCVSKPIGRQAFIAALDETLARSAASALAPAGCATPPDSSAADD